MLRDPRKLTEQRHYETKAETTQITTDSLGAHGVDVVLRKPYEEYERSVLGNTTEGAVVVDLAAGTGVHSLIARTHASLIIATDISYQAIRVAKKLAADSNFDLNAICADGENLPLRKGSVDVVTCAGALYCFDHPTVVKETRRVLRTDGKLILVDSFDHNPIYRINRLVGWMLGSRTRLAYKNIPTRQTIRLIRNSFSSVTVSFHGLFTFAAPLLSPLLGRQRTARLLDAADSVFGFARLLAFKIVVVAAEPIADRMD